MLKSTLAAACAAAVALCACSGGSTSSPLPPTTTATSGSRTESALALPGGGALALPGGGALALPGGGALALPGGGALALPGGGALALPGGTNGLLAALVNALPVCSIAAIVIGSAQCTALLNTAIPVIPDANLLAAAIAGLHPADVQSAYRLPSGAGAGQTVAVVDAGDDPTAESDLAVYRNAFGLSPCSSANGCFKKVNQSGATGAYPVAISGWAQETAIDLEMVSAVCPACNILLVEGNSAQIGDLGAGVDTAVALGASAISNSYYAPEYNGELADEQHFDHPGTAITVSSGDTGFGTTFPASSRYVTGVGGTTLVRGGLRGWTESVWAASGSGCSAYVGKPAWQHDAGCPNRTVTDVAAVGDPKTGVAIYATTAPSGQQGWGVYGGTSVGAPIVAAAYALAGNARGVQFASSAYANPGAFNPIVTGSNGSCSPSYLCTAGPGYNGPAGLGSPNGVGGL